MTITPTTKLLLLILVILILFTGVYFKIQSQGNNKSDRNLMVTPNISHTETTPSNITENQDNEYRASCEDIPKSDNPSAGITYLESYCMGSYCQPESIKENCEAVDVVTISDGKLNTSWGQDNVGDCIWIETAPELVRCQVKYKRY